MFQAYTYDSWRRGCSMKFAYFYVSYSLYDEHGEKCLSECGWVVGWLVVEGSVWREAAGWRARRLNAKGSLSQRSIHAPQKKAKRDGCTLNKKTYGYTEQKQSTHTLPPLLLLLLTATTHTFIIIISSHLCSAHPITAIIPGTQQQQPLLPLQPQPSVHPSSHIQSPLLLIPIILISSFPLLHCYSLVLLLWPVSSSLFCSLFTTKGTYSLVNFTNIFLPFA